MFRKTLAAFAAVAAAFAVGTPVASAAVNVQGVSVNKTPERIAFFVNAPDPGERLALFVDTNGVTPDPEPEEGDFFSSDVVLLVDADLSVQALKTSDSTRYCQQVDGIGTTQVPLGDTTAAMGDFVTVTVPTADLTALGVGSAFDVAGGSYTAADTVPDPEDCAAGFLNTPMGPSSTTHVGAVYAPQAPTGLTGVAGNGHVTVSWDAPADAVEYALYMNGEGYPVAVTDQTSFTVEGLTNGQSYNFTVRAGNMSGASGHSSPISVTPLAPVVIPPVTPQPPVNPTNPLDPDADGIRNDWTVDGKLVAAPAKPKLGKVTGKSATVKLPKAPKGGKLAVYFRTGNGKFAKAKGKPNKKGELTVKGLKKNTTYEVKLVKVNPAGKQSVASKALKVKTMKK